MKRKFKQITATPLGKDNALLFALAEDGTCWKLEVTASKTEKSDQWQNIPALPDSVSKGFFDQEK